MEVKEEIKVSPKIKLSFNSVLVTAKKLNEGSKIITDMVKNPGQVLREVQKVVAIGPFVKETNGVDINVGDNVVLSPRIKEGNSKLVSYAFNKFTGEYVEYGADYVEKDLEFYLLVTDRDILGVV